MGEGLAPAAASDRDPSPQPLSPKRGGGRSVAANRRRLATYNSPMLFDSLAIVGVGLIGGSVGLAAKARAATRRVVGSRPQSRDARPASELGRHRRIHDRPGRRRPLGRRRRLLLAGGSDRRAGPRGGPVREARGPVHRRRQHQGEHRPRPGRQTLPSHVRSSGPPAGRVREAGGRKRLGRPVRRPRLRPHADGQTDPAAVERATLFWQALGCDVKHADPRGARPGPGDDQPPAALASPPCSPDSCRRSGGVHRHRLPRHDAGRRRRPGPVDRHRPRERPGPVPRTRTVRRQA